MDKKFIALMAVFFLVFGVFVTSMVFNNQFFKIGRSTQAAAELEPSSQNSLIYAWPLDVSLSEGKTSEINIFVRSGNNLVLRDKKVQLITDFGSLDQAEKTTDKTGKATFVLTSDVEGIANLSATINNTIPLSQKISIRFKQ